MKPVRIQRSRQRKQVSPNGLPVVYVGRPSKWGNPYKLDEENGMDRGFAYDSFKYLFIQDNPTFVEAVKIELKGKNLSCWCPIGEKCHADLLLELANK